MWWLMAILPAPGRLRKEDHHQFNNNLGYIEILSQKHCGEPRRKLKGRRGKGGVKKGEGHGEGQGEGARRLKNGTQSEAGSQL